MSADSRYTTSNDFFLASHFVSVFDKYSIRLDCTCFIFGNKGKNGLISLKFQVLDVMDKFVTSDIEQITLNISLDLHPKDIS